jgi:hypothetical protein
MERFCHLSNPGEIPVVSLFNGFNYLINCEVLSMGQVFFHLLCNASCFIVVSDGIFKDSMLKMFDFLPSRWSLISVFV